MFKNKIVKALVLAGLLASSSSFAKDIETFSLNERDEAITVKVQENAKRIAVVDYGALDILDNLGLADNIIAMPKNAKVPHLQKFFDRKDIVDIGTLKEVDFEKLMELEPDLIVIGKRAGEQYQKFSKIAPTVFIKMFYDRDYLKVLDNNVQALAKIYAKEDKAKELMQPLYSRFKALKEKGDGKRALITLITSNSIHTIGNTARSSLIATEWGFNNLAADTSSNHGNEVSFEFVKKVNPDYMFVIDRDSAIGETKTKNARDVLNNDLIKATNAFKTNNIHYLTPTVWYLSDGGISSTKIMLDEVENVFK